MAATTPFVQIRDNSQYLSSSLCCMPFTKNTEQNDAFVLTASTATAITVPSFPCKQVYALIYCTMGADVWVSPVDDPEITVPSTPGPTYAQLIPSTGLFVQVAPNQTLQFIYENTVFADSTVSVGIRYFLGMQNMGYN